MVVYVSLVYRPQKFSSSGTIPLRRRPRVVSSTNANEGEEVRGLADSIGAMLRGVLDKVQPPRSVRREMLLMQGQ